ncbi:MAG: hypothetical protein J6Y02_18410 [Pseudobutyrivibrio sp.]|nr:hypothetical protein [Pseudobutyrivibrio sp.]
MWAPTISSDELWHHGIQGQQWGHRNGPPYPLDPKSDYSKEERKAVKKAYSNIRKNVSHVGRTDAKIESLKKKSAKLKSKSQYAKDTGKDNSKYEQKIKESQAKIKQLLNDPKYKADSKVLQQNMKTINRADIELGKAAVDKAISQRQTRDCIVGSIAATAMYNAGIAACYAAGIPVNVPRFLLIPDIKTGYANKYIKSNRTSMKHSDELYHFGILGQKWGKRNGPPYPLDEGDHSASEKKAGYKKSIAKGGNTPSKEISSTKSSDKNDYSDNMDDVIKKHELKQVRDIDDGKYACYETKEGPNLTYFRDEYEPSAREIDEVLSNYSKADKKAIFENAKDYAWKEASSYWPETAGTEEEFKKQFDKEYEISSLYLTKGNKSVEVSVDLKPDMWKTAINSVLGGHELCTDYDKDFKKRASYGWAVNG